MKIKKGDNVKILSGKDRGKMGKVLRFLPKDKKAIVEGLNLVKKHVRPRKQGEKGQRVSVPAAIGMSNLMLVCPKCSKPTRVGYKQGEKNKFRICKKCKSEI
ncbi:MAG: 50S ribosomal protein L24 [Candidatus Moranbacteria bacterium RBG_13_45_13]|nr:MAG: 50S ribosomal protein L24 [Candidatus Moranbacteria bacterium RBG_13_45_13]